MSKSVTRAVATALVILVTVSGTATAASGDAEAALSEGRAAYSTRDLEGAIRAYERAAKLDIASPVADRELARCHDELGRIRRALPYYRTYLEKRPDADDAGDVRARISEIEAELKKAKPGDDAAPAVLVVDVRPDGAHITVDGADKGTRRLSLDPGEHTVSASLEGFEPWTTRVSLRAGARTLLVTALTPVATPTVETPPEVATPGSPPSATEPPAAVAPPEKKRKYGWAIGLGIAVAVVAGGAVAAWAILLRPTDITDVMGEL